MYLFCYPGKIHTDDPSVSAYMHTYIHTYDPSVSACMYIYISICICIQYTCEGLLFLHTTRTLRVNSNYRLVLCPKSESV